MDFTAFCRNLFLLLHPPVENIGLSKEKLSFGAFNARKYFYLACPVFIELIELV